MGIRSVRSLAKETLQGGKYMHKGEGKASGEVGKKRSKFGIKECGKRGREVRLRNQEKVTEERGEYRQEN